MISLEKVTKTFMKKVALENVDLQLSTGKIIGIVGENGSGKSTMLKLIAGLIQPSKGTVLVNGKKASRLAHDVAYFSELDVYYHFYNVGQTIEFYSSQFPDFNKEKAEEILQFMKLDKKVKLDSLSKGNRGQLKVVLTLAREVPVLLIDEPLSSGFDPLVRELIVKGLIHFTDLEKQVVLIAIATKEIKKIETILDEVILIKKGTIIGHRNVDELRDGENVGIVEWITKTYQ